MLKRKHIIILQYNWYGVLEYTTVQCNFLGFGLRVIGLNFPRMILQFNHNMVFGLRN